MTKLSPKDVAIKEAESYAYDGTDSFHAPTVEAYLAGLLAERKRSTQLVKALIECTKIKEPTPDETFARISSCAEIALTAWSRETGVL